MYATAKSARLVAPYTHEYRKVVGPRWAQSTLGDVYGKEFSDETTFPFLQRAIALGLITVNAEAVTEAYKLKLGDSISHFSHRHEPPVAYVSAADLIVHDDGDLIVINKPATVPIHPCGAYNHNSALMILKNEANLDNLHTIHRIDRMTSGLCLLSRTAAAAKPFHAALARLDPALSARKAYLALVKGAFPTSLADLRLPESLARDLQTRQDSPDFAVEVLDRGQIEVRYPVEVIDPKRGVHACLPEGRPSTSRFKLLHYDSSSDTSLVAAEPITGRTHQLRLHLQLMGLPIANDYAYGGTDEFEPPSSPPQLRPVFHAVPSDSLETRLLAACPSCNGLVTPVKRSGIYLHALRFSLLRNGVVEADYTTPLPSWAATRIDIEDYMKSI